MAVQWRIERLAHLNQLLARVHDRAGASHFAGEGHVEPLPGRPFRARLVAERMVFDGALKLGGRPSPIRERLVIVVERR